MPVYAKRRPVQPNPLQGVAMNAARSFTYGCEDATHVILSYSLDRVAATDLSFKLEVQGYDDVWREIEALSSSGVISSFSPIVQSGISADVEAALPRIPVSGKNFKCTVTATSGGTTDLLTIAMELEY